MALRFVLVSLVATLGFDLPKGADLVRLVNSGQSWAVSQWREWKDFMAEEGDALASADPTGTTPEEAPKSSDPEPPALAALSEIADDEGTDFRHEVRLPDLAKARTMDADSTTIEVIEQEEAEESLASTPADELDDDRFSELVNAMVADLATEPVEDSAEVLASNDDGASSSPHVEETTTVIEAESEATNFRTAVRLTGQAVQAWMSVLQQTTPQGF